MSRPFLVGFDMGLCSNLLSLCKPFVTLQQSNLTTLMQSSICQHEVSSRTFNQGIFNSSLNSFIKKRIKSRENIYNIILEIRIHRIVWSFWMCHIILVVIAGKLIKMVSKIKIQNNQKNRKNKDDPSLMRILTNNRKSILLFTKHISYILK